MGNIKGFENYGNSALCETKAGCLIVFRHNKGTDILPLVGKSVYIEDTKDDDAVSQFTAVASEFLDFFKLGKAPYQALPKRYKAGSLSPDLYEAISVVDKPPFRALPIDDIKEDLKAAGFDSPNLTGSGGLVLNGVKRDYSACVKASKETQKLLDTVLNNKAATFHLLPRYEKLLKKIVNSHVSMVWLCGPSGTGKSTVFWTMAARMKAPAVQACGQPGLDYDQLVCAIVPNKNASSLNGEPQFVVELMPLLRAYSEGYWFLLDEINMMIPEYLAAINSCIDGTPSITTRDGTVFKRHPNFVLFVTSNPGYTGTNLMNRALKSRFAKVIYVPKLEPKDFCERLMVSFGKQFSKKFLNLLYAYGDYVQTLSRAYSESYEVTIRNAESFIQGVYSEPHSLEEFTEELEWSYIYPATMLDKDNKDKLFTHLSNSEYRAKVEELYDAYELKGSGTSQPLWDLDSVFQQSATTVGGASKGVEDDAVSGVFDDLMNSLQ